MMCAVTRDFEDGDKVALHSAVEWAKQLAELGILTPKQSKAVAWTLIRGGELQLGLKVAERTLCSSYPDDLDVIFQAADRRAWPPRSCTRAVFPCVARARKNRKTIEKAAKVCEDALNEMKKLVRERRKSSRQAVMCQAILGSQGAHSILSEKRQPHLKAEQLAFQTRRFRQTRHAGTVVPSWVRNCHRTDHPSHWIWHGPSGQQSAVEWPGGLPVVRLLAVPIRIVHRTSDVTGRQSRNTQHELCVGLYCEEAVCAMCDVVHCDVYQSSTTI